MAPRPARPSGRPSTRPSRRRRAESASTGNRAPTAHQPPRWRVSGGRMCRRTFPPRALAEAAATSSFAGSVIRQNRCLRPSPPEAAQDGSQPVDHQLDIQPVARHDLGVVTVEVHRQHVRLDVAEERQTSATARSRSSHRSTSFSGVRIRTRSRSRTALANASRTSGPGPLDAIDSVTTCSEVGRTVSGADRRFVYRRRAHHVGDVLLELRRCKIPAGIYDAWVGLYLAGRLPGPSDLRDAS